MMSGQDRKGVWLVGPTHTAFTLMGGITLDLREAVFLADRIFCMSARPGRIIAERVVDLPRPRDLEITYTSAFMDIVHELRGHIAHARVAA